MASAGAWRVPGGANLELTDLNRYRNTAASQYVHQGAPCNQSQNILITLEPKRWSKHKEPTNAEIQCIPISICSDGSRAVLTSNVRCCLRFNKHFYLCIVGRPARGDRWDLAQGPTQARRGWETNIRWNIWNYSLNALRKYLFSFKALFASYLHRFGVLFFQSGSNWTKVWSIERLAARTWSNDICITVLASVSIWLQDRC